MEKTIESEADGLFERWNEDFNAVYTALVAKIKAILPSAAPLPSHSPDWSGLTAHKVQVHRLLEVQEDLEVKQRQMRYREELDRQVESRRKEQGVSRLRRINQQNISNDYQDSFTHTDTAETRRKQVNLT